MRRRAGQLRDRDRGSGESRGATGVEGGLGRGGLLAWGVRIYFGTGSLSARKRDARRSQCGTGAPPASVSRLPPSKDMKCESLKRKKGKRLERY